MGVAKQANRKPANPKIRFMRKVAFDINTGCWLWQGSLDRGGYGLFRTGGVDAPRVGPHRYSYEWFIGPIPDGLELDHLCRVRNCVNPDHLDPVTTRTNALRSPRARRTHCANGHDPSNYYLSARGKRVCRSCTSLYNARYYYKDRETR